MAPSSHDRNLRLPGDLFRAMGTLYLRERPEACQERLARTLKRHLEAVGINYHIRTLRRQLTGTVVTVPAQVEDAMRDVILRVNGIRTNLDIERALAAAGLSVSLARRRPDYVSTERILPLAQLWLLRNPKRSRRSLAVEISGRLVDKGIHVKVDPLQVVLAGQRRTARREILQVLLELLSKQGIVSEAEARERCAELAEKIASYKEARELQSADRLMEMALAWKVQMHELSSRRLAVMLRDTLLTHDFDLGLHRIQEALDGKVKNVRAVLLKEMEALLRDALPEGQDLAEAVAKAAGDTDRLIDFHLVDAKPIASLAKQWVAERPNSSMRQLAIRVAKTARRMGYATSHNTIQPILGGHTSKTRGFVYRAMLKQLPGHRQRVPMEHVLPSHSAETTLPYRASRAVTAGRGRSLKASSGTGVKSPKDYLLAAYPRSMTDESSAMGQPYEIVLVQRAEPPPGGKGSNWYRYVIAYEGTNNIHGCRQGGLNAVTRAVEEIVAQLNERHFGKPRRVQLVLQKKPHNL